MKIRINGWLCECGSALLPLDPLDIPRRRMKCINPGCPEVHKVVFEPLFEAEEVADALTVVPGT